MNEYEKKEEKELKKTTSSGRKTSTGTGSPPLVHSCANFSNELPHRSAPLN